MIFGDKLPCFFEYQRGMLRALEACSKMCTACSFCGKLGSSLNTNADEKDSTIWDCLSLSCAKNEEILERKLPGVGEVVWKTQCGSQHDSKELGPDWTRGGLTGEIDTTYVYHQWKINKRLEWNE